MTTYTVDFTNISLEPIQILEGTVDVTSTDVALFGRIRLEYGELLNEDLLHILENFSCPEDAGNPGNPDLTQTIDELLSSPVIGQLWHNSTTGVIYYWTGVYWLPLRRGEDIAANWGVIAHGQQLPLPVSPTTGYVFSYDECIWSVAPAAYDGQPSIVNCTSDPTDSTVTMQYTLSGGGGTIDGYVNYLIIGIRNNTNAGAGVTVTPTPTATTGLTPTPTPTPSTTPASTPAATPTPTPTAGPTPTPTSSPIPPSPTPSPSADTQNVMGTNAWTLDDFVEGVSGEIARCIVTVNPDGTLDGDTYNDPGLVYDENWHSGAPTASDPENYEARLRVISGGLPDFGSPSIGVWHKLSSIRQWVLTENDAAPPPIRSTTAEWELDIRRNDGVIDPAITKAISLSATIQQPSFIGDDWSGTIKLYQSSGVSPVYTRVTWNPDGTFDVDENGINTFTYNWATNAPSTVGSNYIMKWVKADVGQEAPNATNMAEDTWYSLGSLKFIEVTDTSGGPNESSTYDVTLALYDGTSGPVSGTEVTLEVTITASVV